MIWNGLHQCLVNKSLNSFKKKRDSYLTFNPNGTINLHSRTFAIPQFAFLLHIVLLITSLLLLWTASVNEHIALPVTYLCRRKNLLLYMLLEIYDCCEENIYVEYPLADLGGSQAVASPLAPRKIFLINSMQPN
jgi:hypothetical protein